MTLLRTIFESKGCLSDEKDAQVEHYTFPTLITKKKLNPKSFQTNSITLADEISKHAAWLFQHVYRFPYPREAKRQDQGIARRFHGIQHASRAAMYIPVFANLYRRYEDKVALEDLKAEDIKLLQIAALFHDAGREAEGIDIWDRESATLLYYYLKLTLKIPDEKAKLLAEAVANKDAEDDYFELNIEKDKVSWIQSFKRPKNIFQKLIHDADCLDIIRVKDHFDAEYLDFYKQFAKSNPQAFNEMARIITDVRSITEIQGDVAVRMKSIKRYFEQTNAYQMQLETIKNKHFKILPTLYANGNLIDTTDLKNPLIKTIPFDSKQPLTEQQFQAALDSDDVFVLVRGVITPSAIRIKQLKDEKKEHKSFPEETLGEVETRKALRRFGTATRSSKSNNTTKQGNPNRSMALIGNGGSVYCDAGFITIVHDEESRKGVQQVNAVNIASGRFKKKHLPEEKAQYSDTEIREQLKELSIKQKKGGSSTRLKSFENYPATHTEVLYHITDFDAIYYSPDPNFYNYIVHKSPYPRHSDAPLLQALYLQKIYEKQTGKTLPIFEYSGIHNYANIKSYTNKEIIDLYSTISADYVQLLLAKKDFTVLEMSLDDIKTLAVYGKLSNLSAKRNAPTDTCFDEKLRQQINDAMNSAREKVRQSYEDNFLKEFLQNKTSVLDDSNFINLIHLPRVRAHPDVESRIRQELEKEMKELDLVSVLTKETGNIFHSEDNEYCCQLFLNKKETFKKLGPQNFYSKKIIKLYSMAHALDMEQITKKLKECAVSQVKTLTTELTERPGDFHYSQGIINLLKFVATFDLNDDLEVKENVKNAIYSFMKFASQHVLKYDSKWRDYSELVVILKKSDLLDGELIKLVETTTQLCVDQLTILKKNPSIKYLDFLSYVTLAQHAGFDLSLIKTHLLKILNNPEFLLEFEINSSAALKGPDVDHYLDSIKRLAEQGFLDDKEIFEAIINKISCHQNLSLDKLCGGLKSFLSFLIYIETYLPNGEFNAWQEELVNQIKKKRIEEVIRFFIANMQGLKRSHFASSNFTLSKYYFEFDTYIRIAQQAKIPLSEQQKVFAQWLKLGDTKFRAIDLRRIEPAISLLGNNLELFEIFINKIEDSTAGQFAENIKALEEIMPNEIFTEEEQGIIRKRYQVLLGSGAQNSMLFFKSVDPRSDKPSAPRPSIYQLLSKLSA